MLQVEDARSTLTFLQSKQRAVRMHAAEYAYRIDLTTTAIYGPHADEKNNFGIPPKKPTHKTPDPSDPA